MEEKYNTSSILKILIIVIIIAGIFYFLTILVTDNKKQEINMETEQAVIQYNEIIIGEMFNQKQDEYYVLLKKENDPYINYYENNLLNYKSMSNALKVYTVDLSNAFNKKYLSKTNKIEKDDFKISTTVLLKISDHDIEEYFDNSKDIMSELKNMMK